MEKKKLIAEFDCTLPEDLTIEQFVKLMADYLLLCRFTLNVHRIDCVPIETKVNIHLVSLPSGTERVN